MDSKDRKYGLITLVSTVIGTVIGSGIFFKTEKILDLTDRNALVGLLAFAVGGSIMLICAGAFASLAGESGGNMGIVGYAEEMCGRGYARFVAIFSAYFYFPSMTAVLSRVSAEYLCIAVRWNDRGLVKMLMAGVLAIAFFALNTFAVKGAAAFQICSTAVKLLPLVAVAVIGSIVAAKENSFKITLGYAAADSFLPALLSAAFAYEGWIAVMSLGREAKDATKNIPKALIFGSAAVFVIYAAYYVGLVASANGDSQVAFEKLFGNAGGRIMMIFVAVSCLGALNGLTMSTVRGQYILREDRNANLRNVKTFAMLKGLLVTVLWLAWIFASENKALGTKIKIFVDPAEVSVSVIYGIYIPIFLSMMLRCKRLSNFRRYVLMPMAIMASGLMLFAAPISFGGAVFYYLAVLALVCVLVFRKA